MTLILLHIHYFLILNNTSMINRELQLEPLIDEEALFLIHILTAASTNWFQQCLIKLSKTCMNSE